MTLFQALLLAAIQGVTELFPVSSLGHAVILPRLFGWSLDEHDPSFLPFLVMLHLGTAAALFLYFWRDWIGILAALFGRGEPRAVAAGRRLLVLLVLGTLPAVVLGGLLEHPLRRLFGSPEFVAGILALNGIVLFTAEKLRRRATGQQGLESLRIRQVLIVGFAQAGALIPGFSRSGLTIGAGLGLGLSHGHSARLSFLLALPIILGASALEIPKLLHHHPAAAATAAAAQSGHPIGLGVSLLAGLVAGLTAYASTAFLMRLFRKPEFEALNPFALYCLLAGLGALALLATGTV